MSDEEAKNKLEKLSSNARTTLKRALEERILPAKASGGDVENDIRLSPDIEAIDEMPDQAFTSENTSRNQIPALFNSPAFERKRGSRNLDYGGGAFDKGSEYLAQEHGVDSQVYDPFNREKEHNDFVLTGFKKEPADTATVANVLNVIAEPEARLHAIKQVHNHIKPDGKAYFTVYEGDGKEKGSGNSRMTRDGWQEYRPTHSYVEEIKQVFPDVRLSGKTIVASKKAAKAYGGALIPGPKLTEENADDFARRLIAWTFATAPLFHKASGGSVIDDPLDVISKLRR
jgi:SAM-dependent methyltransferase